MELAGEETSAALGAAVELLSTSWTRVERWQIADLHLAVAGFRWKRREFPEGIRSAIQAVRMRPKVLGLPLEALVCSESIGSPQLIVTLTLGIGLIFSTYNRSHSSYAGVAANTMPRSVNPLGAHGRSY